MKTLKIFLCHLAVFIFGSVGIVAYIFYHLSLSTGNANPGVIIAMPVIAFVYIVGFGILCLVSLAIFLLVFYLRARR